MRSPVRASLGAHGVASVPQCGLQAPDLSVCGARHDAWNHAWTCLDHVVHVQTKSLGAYDRSTRQMTNHGHGLLV